MSSQRFTAPVFTLILTALTLLGSPQAQAHAHLKTQYPAANASMTAAPQALTLTFSEGIEAGFSGLTLTGPGNEPIPTGAVKVDPTNPMQIIVPIEKPLTAGEYRVQWHVVSVDSHKTQGSYQFSVK
ncbi:CopC domain-containing protein YobA [Acerihabitans arboris]|uniref:Copper resistance protein C n=1 Tax=Acerihabitans arboris TaxID=2691583 RepID=A0A845SIT1_9GAMM|nr:CopC domain-containing protein YobA [Acerihabitans arboris]NDL62541.1 CopC domain-containing protein YobA [Acerihabitans arboris]